MSSNDSNVASAAAAEAAAVDTNNNAIMVALNDAADRANVALKELVVKIKEYDEQYQASEKANSIMGPALDFARARIDDVRSTLDTIRMAPGYATETSVALAQQALTRANAALLTVKTVAHQYDERLQLSTTLWSSIASARDGATAAVADASAVVQDVQTQVYTRVEGVRSSYTSSAARAAAASYAHKVADTAKSLDSKFGVTETARSLDARYSVSEKAGVAAERAAALDQQVTGGMGSRVVQKGRQIAEQGLDYLGKQLQAEDGEGDVAGVTASVEEVVLEDKQAGEATEQ